jgi:hypothetical protein
MAQTFLHVSSIPILTGIVTLTLGSEVKTPVTTSAYICVEPVAVGPTTIYIALLQPLKFPWIM